MRVLQLEVQNFCNLELVEVALPPHMIEITGKNEQGKTSLINSIFWALCGAKESPAQPIRKGADQAKVKVWLGSGEQVELIVTKRQTEKSTLLEVTDAQGHVIKRPQEVLDKLVSSISFDPTVFVRERPDKRKNLLLDVCGVRHEVEALDAKRKEIYDQRTVVGRDKTSLKARVEATPSEIKLITGDAEKAADELEASLNATVSENEKFGDEIQRAETELYRLRTNDTNYETRIRQQSALIDNEVAEIERLKRELQSRESRLAQAGADLDEIVKQKEQNALAIKGKQDEIAALPQPNPEALQEALANIKTARQKAEAWRAYQKTKAEHQQKESEYDGLTAAISAIDEQKRELISGAIGRVGVDYTIGLDENDNINVNGLPFDSHSTAGQLKISTALSMAANPTLRLLRITHGSEIDDDGMKMLYELAQHNDFDILVERVTNGPGTGIYIQEGRVVE